MLVFEHDVFGNLLAKVIYLCACLGKMNLLYLLYLRSYCLYFSGKAALDCLGNVGDLFV